jgi:HTH-type transcriptional regulator/antitoxin HigA
MNSTTASIDPAAILQAWMPFKELVGVTSVKTEEDYERAAALVNMLLDAIRDDAAHPLSDVLHYLTVQMADYEAAQVEIPEARPRDVLRLLMEQHGLKQADLTDCAPQGHISAILSGKRGISKAMAKKFAKRFAVSPDLFF